MVGSSVGTRFCLRGFSYSLLFHRNEFKKKTVPFIFYDFFLDPEILGFAGRFMVIGLLIEESGGKDRRLIDFPVDLSFFFLSLHPFLAFKAQLP